MNLCWVGSRWPRRMTGRTTQRVVPTWFMAPTHGAGGVAASDEPWDDRISAGRNQTSRRAMTGGGITGGARMGGAAGKGGGVGP